MKLGKDLDQELSFNYLAEKDRTKHVHRLHPYKGKFIPQLVEHFVASHFKKGDIILDPFCGSGTTLVQANELGIHAIGIDISRFNSLISEVKLLDYDFDALEKEIESIYEEIIDYEKRSKVFAFERELDSKLREFNRKYFVKGKRYKGTYKKEKERDFLQVFRRLVEKYDIELKQKSDKRFLDKWFVASVRREIGFVFELIKKVKDIRNKKLLAVVLSRTMRSCRATSHMHLGTLRKPQYTTYYCQRHKRICSPLFSIGKWFGVYARDTLRRIKEFNRLKSDSFSCVIAGDSRNVNIFEEVKKKNGDFYKLLKKQKIGGIFTSPPYVGQIDYHEQHAYAYDLFGFARRDDEEIGSKSLGKSEKAKKRYVDEVAEVLINCRKYMVEDFDVFIVANDKYRLYPRIAKKAGLKLVRKFKRPVLNRVERNRLSYSEVVFHYVKS